MHNSAALARVDDDVWDALVIGAGPAGGMAALRLAQAGARTLLVDRAVFPRDKVCGACFNAAALRELERAGVGELPGRVGQVRLDTLRVRSGRCVLDVRLAGSVAISRTAFDAELVRCVTAAGGTFLPGVSARVAGLEPGVRAVRLRSSNGVERIAQARVVLVADGLNGRSLRDCAGFERTAVRGSRIGMSTALPDGPGDFDRGVIHMHCGRGGYVGIVRLADGSLNVAAALDPMYVRAAGSPGEAVRELLRLAGSPDVPELVTADWHGTAELSHRRSRVAGERVLVIGDAAGYVEPFTGEGIAWALACGNLAAPLALMGIQCWEDAIAREWTQTYAAHVRARQRLCRSLRIGLRHPRLTGLALRMLARFPDIADELARRTARPWTFPAGAVTP